MSANRRAPLRFHDDLLRGVIALPARREPWMDAVLDDHDTLQRLIDRHGSPINLLRPGPLSANLAELVAAGDRHGVTVRIRYARKANKALCFVDEALACGHGVDVAGERELRQAVDRAARLRAPVSRVILTAAVKPPSLLATAVAAGVTISVDNLDEWRALRAVAATRPSTAPAVPVALRIRADLPDRPWSRFGEPAETWIELASRSEEWSGVRLAGLHFHLDGYDAADRASALDQSLDLLELVGRLGHRPGFVDIGGGVPMSYLDTSEGWEEFWRRHLAAAADTSEDTMTWRGRRLGTVYPAWQRPVRGQWLSQVLDAPSAAAASLGARLRALGVDLHLEPGRALLDGAGMTIASVVQRKRWPDGTMLIGVAMNRTQCRSAADDFLVDPLLVPAPDAERDAPGEGFLVGAYCIEAELLTWRRLRFPAGVAVGDLIAWPNTAGYLMHILESASHQIPLAVNLVGDEERGWAPDRIDDPRMRP